VHLIYLDESGDPGRRNSPTSHYILAGLSLPASQWHEVNNRLTLFRAWAQQHHALGCGHEIHAAEFLGAANLHCGLNRSTRLLIIRKFIGVLTLCPELRFFGWIDPKDADDPLERTGHRCLADLENWVKSGYFGTSNALFLIHDEMTRQPEAWLRPENGVVIERPLAIDSQTSNLLQAADLIAYLLKQSRNPNRYLKEQGAQHLIKKFNEKSLGWVDL
jgi:hypothetical protein